MNAQRLVIRKTKLHPPRNDGRTIGRARLMDFFDTPDDTPITLLTAPAGSGKTTVMVQAFHHFCRMGKLAGWLSFDQADNDVIALTSLVVSALRSCAPFACSATAILLETGLLPPEEVLQRTLVNELAELQQDIALFIDDYHCITERRAIESLNQLFEANNRRLRFFVATRNQNDISVSRYRLRGTVREVSFDELRFDAEETRRILHFWGHTDVTENQSDLLCDKTEGWVAGLQLASIALTNEQNKDEFIRAFSGTNKSIDGFLSDEMFLRHPEPVQQFLLNTSVLERFTAELCNAVNPDCQNYQSLKYIEQWNLFLVPLDNERKWFRYHHLFIDYLRCKLKAIYPERVAELHRIAARWLFESGMVTEAIGHAFASGDRDFAGQLLDEGSDALFSAGRTMTLDAYAQRLTDCQLRRLPRLLLDRAWQNELRWRFHEAAIDLRDARAVIQDMSDYREGTFLNPIDLTYLQEKLSHREMMLELLADRNAEALAAAQRWIAARRSGDMFMYASSLSAKILAEREFYRFDLMLSRAEDVRKMFVTHGASYGTVFHDSIVGRALQRCGHLDHAASILSRSLDVAIALHGPMTPLAAMPTALLSSIAYERNELDQARIILAGYLPQSKELGFVDNMMEAFITSVRLAVLERNFPLATALLDEAEATAKQFEFDRMRAGILLERVRLSAREPFFDCDPGLFDFSFLPKAFEDPIALTMPSTRHEIAALIHCELWIAEGLPKKAIPVLKRWLSFCRRNNAQASVAALSALLVRALILNDDLENAQRLLTEVLKVLAHGRFIRTFADQGPALRPALIMAQSRISEDFPTIADYVGEIVAAVTPGFQPQAGTINDEGGLPVEALREREVEILRLADRGLSNSEIAGELAIAESTVKWYWQGIYSKFSVRGRRLAIRAARNLGLIGFR
jgi:LuxR family transcriptional regulator, maltose regulon positive regulatory protein